MSEDKPQKETPEEKKRRTNRELFMSLELVTKLGVTIALVAGGFIWGGIELDRRFGTKQAFTLIFLVLSIPVSVYAIYVLLEPIIGEEKRRNFLKRKKDK